MGEDGVTPEVHPPAQVDVGAGIVSDFVTHYLTENRRRVPMFVKKYINGSFEFLGAPAPLRTNETPWIDNVLVPSPSWGVGGTVEKSNWGSKPGGRYGGVSVPWCVTVPDCPVYVPRSPEIRASLRAASVAISFERIVWHASKVSPITASFSVIVWSIRGISPRMISGMRRLMNNLYRVFPLVV